MADDLWPEIVCPRCRGRAKLRRRGAHVECAQCGARYPVVDEVIDFLAQTEQDERRDD